MTTTTEIAAVYYLPGSFVAEETTLVLSEGTPEEALSKAPKRAFAFKLRTTKVAEIDDQILRGQPEYSGHYYLPGAVQLSKDEVAEAEGERSILRRNMEYNGWDYVVRTKLGNYQPLEANDVVLAVREEV